MPIFASLGERMKFYEQQQNAGVLCPMLPAIIRLDGRAFHTFTRDMCRPFDQGFSDLMLLVTEFLVEETSAQCGYTQSDEITLVLKPQDVGQQFYFDGRIDKINSVLAAECSVEFNIRMRELWPEKAGKKPVFDCRCFSVPNETEAVNNLVWREQDAVRNSVQMLGQAYFSAKELHKKSCAEIQEMLWAKHSINWDHTLPWFKRGSYIQRRAVERKFTAEEINDLPPNHQARRNPELLVVRQDTVMLDMPPITKVLNATDVVFRGHDPITASSLSDADRKIDSETGHYCL